MHDNQFELTQSAACGCQITFIPVYPPCPQNVTIAYLKKSADGLVTYSGSFCEGCEEQGTFLFSFAGVNLSFTLDTSTSTNIVTECNGSPVTNSRIAGSDATLNLISGGAIQPLKVDFEIRITEIQTNPQFTLSILTRINQRVILTTPNPIPITTGTCPNTFTVNSPCSECLCQGTITPVISTVPVTITTRTSTINDTGQLETTAPANFCTGCNSSQNALSVIFAGDMPLLSNFNFSSDSTQPLFTQCSPSLTSLTANGTGTLQYLNQLPAQHISYQLVITLNDAACSFPTACSYQMTINSPDVLPYNPDQPTIVTGTACVSCQDVSIENCP